MDEATQLGAISGNGADMAAHAPFAAAGLDPVDPAYVKVLYVALFLGWAPVAIGLTAVDWLAVRAMDGPLGLLTVAAWLGLAILVFTLPPRKYARLGYAMTGDELRVARGYFWRTDTLVPFVRVQHIDVGQGPVERRYGLSHLVVHTSGTHNSTVTLPGLPSDQAAAMRDTIRQQIKSDFQ
jgi:uncharacterized protein